MVPAQKVSRDDLHVTREDKKVCRFGAHNGPQICFPLFYAPSRVGHMVKRHLSLGEEGLEVRARRVVADDEGYGYGDFAAAGSVQQVKKAVVCLRHEAVFDMKTPIRALPVSRTVRIATALDPVVGVTP
eukprot:CAMPEP_0185791064 /NCGR_PEP_ID=MMETSP1174-20130828/158165_1 /TAXON_ID=35687 /ORGANISM="Dictyocha speculum, Strain CCMP1381" /LENGTH=128 /DNA_ID=CAMNT_0028485965 /DNA_START=156 /DNA_END=542 /DNA_ORIENTATION=-